MRTRFNERRNKPLVSVIQFLQNPHILKSSINFEELKLSSKAEILKTIKDIMDKYFHKESYSEEGNDSEVTKITTVSSQLQTNCTTLFDKLQENVASRFKTMPINEDINRSLTKEISLFELNGIMTSNLRNILEALKTIKPTSTESERVFSLCGTFVTKRRSALGDDTINMLCFLKSYFNKNKF